MCLHRTAQIFSVFPIHNSTHSIHIIQLQREKKNVMIWRKKSRLADSIILISLESMQINTDKPITFIHNLLLCSTSRFQILLQVLYHTSDVQSIIWRRKNPPCPSLPPAGPRTHSWKRKTTPLPVLASCSRHSGPLVSVPTVWIRQCPEHHTTAS